MIIILGSGTYYLVNKNETTRSSSQKIYVNDRLGFSFSYPSIYELIDESNANPPSVRVSKKNVPERTYSTHPLMLVSTLNAYADINVVKQSVINYLSSDKNNKIDNIEELNFGEIRAVRVDRTTKDGMDVPSRVVSIFAVKPGEPMFYTASFWQYSATTEEQADYLNMLDSLKFTE